jgi:outer membrane protein TolC
MKFTILALSLSITGAHASPASGYALGDFISAGRQQALPIQAANFSAKEREAASDESFWKLFPRFTAMAGYRYNQWDVSIDVVQRNSMGQPIMDASSNVVTRPVTVMPHHQLDATFSVTAPLFDLEAIHRYRAAKADAGGAQWEVKVSQQTVDATIAREYFRYAGSRAVETSAELLVSYASESLSITEQRVLSGAATTIDLELAQADLEGARLAVKEAYSLRSAARRALLDLTGIDADTVTFRPVAENFRDEAPLDTWLAEVGGLPGVRSAEKGVASAEAQVAAARSQYFPKIAAVASDRLTNAYGLQGHPNSYFVGVTATVNFDFGMPANVRGREAAAGSARVKLDQARRDAANAIITAYEQIAIQQGKCEVTRLKASAARKAAELAAAKYTTALISQQEASRAQQLAYDAQLAHIQAKAELNFARAVLRVSSGRDLRRGN